VSKPTPKLSRGRWTLDLRWAGLGQYTLRTPGIPDVESEAIHESYEVFARERSAADAIDGQGRLFAGPAFGKIAADWLTEREHVTRGGERYVRGYVKCAIERFGGRAIRQFEPPAGSQTLKGWRDEMAAAGLSPKTRRNYLNVVMQVLAYGATRGLVKALPLKPRPTMIEETLASPDYSPMCEADFRQLRAGLFVGSEDAIRPHLEAGDTVDAYIARRRLYASWGFYSGMHVYNLDRLDDSHVSSDFGSYERRNHKSAASVPHACFDCPEQLWLDNQEEIRRLGRRWREGELICGGPWANGSRVLAATAERLGLPLPCNFRSVLRRSTAYEYALRGWSEREVADILGHVDERMIRAVYRRVPIRHRSPVKIPWDLASARKLLGGTVWTSRAKVIPLRPVALAPDVQRRKA
jgi:integrase